MSKFLNIINENHPDSQDESHILHLLHDICKACGFDCTIEEHQLTVSKRASKAPEEDLETLATAADLSDNKNVKQAVDTTKREINAKSPAIIQYLTSLREKLRSIVP